MSSAPLPHALFYPQDAEDLPSLGEVRARLDVAAGALYVADCRVSARGGGEVIRFEFAGSGAKSQLEPINGHVSFAWTQSADVVPGFQLRAFYPNKKGSSSSAIIYGAGWYLYGCEIFPAR